MDSRLVAAVDGSSASTRALQWAAQEARLRGVGLSVVHVMEWPMQFAEGLHSKQMRERAAVQAEQLVDSTVQSVRKDFPDVEVEGWFDIGHVSGVLVERSRQADLLVIGRPTRHGLARLLGGTAGHLIGHASCSLAVIPESRQPESTEVLVGVDDGPSSKAVLATAFGEAQLRGIGVHVLHAYEWPLALGQDDWVTPLYTAEGLRETEELVVAEALAGARADYPDVPVRTSVVNAQAADALLEASSAAALLVVGAQGRGGFLGSLIGSVARTVAYHASAPTLLVRA